MGRGHSRYRGRWGLPLVLWSALLTSDYRQNVKGQEAATAFGPPRPLPQPLAEEPLAERSRFVDALRGNDHNDGTFEHPWKSVQYAVDHLEPGEVLYLRGGVYYERVHLRRSGLPQQPIVIRSYPGELAILDGGVREFYEDPSASWEPVADGAHGEFVSTHSYLNRDTRRVPRHFLPGAREPFLGHEGERPLAFGFLADSMIPLHGYRRLRDLRADNEVFSGKSEEKPLYCGPGLWFNRQTGRIHIRLVPTRLPGLDQISYRGPTDPRQARLAISVGFGDEVLRLNGVSHITIRGIVFRGATGSPLIQIYGCVGIELDHITAYGGFPALLLDASRDVRIQHSAFRGNAAPWSSRAHMKYYGTPSYQIILYNSQPLNENIEISWCEFTDDHDFAFLRFVRNLHFHHNYVDNFNDDGLECGPKLRNHTIYIYQNYIGRSLIPFSQHEIVPDESPADHDPDSGVYIFRNLIDLRWGVYVAPHESDPSGHFLHQEGHVASDHGSPIWPVLRFYHNTVIRRGPTFRNYFLFGLAAQGLRSTERDVFNNIFLQTESPMQVVMPAFAHPVHLREGGNVLWSLAADQTASVHPLDVFRRSMQFGESQKLYPPGWTSLDRWADPRLVDPSPMDTLPDMRLGPHSAAVDAGVPIPGSWPDPLRAADTGNPDSGAIPAGLDGWAVGIDGRIHLGKER